MSLTPSDNRYVCTAIVPWHIWAIILLGL